MYLTLASFSQRRAVLFWWAKLEINSFRLKWSVNMQRNYVKQRQITWVAQAVEWRKRSSYLVLIFSWYFSNEIYGNLLLNMIHFNMFKCDLCIKWFITVKWVYYRSCTIFPISCYILTPTRKDYCPTYYWCSCVFYRYCVSDFLCDLHLCVSVKTQF